MRVAPSPSYALTLCAGLLASSSALADDPPRLADADDYAQGIAPGDDRLPPTQPFVGELDPAGQDAKVIYVNMDGAELSQGQDNSLQDVSAICGGTFPPYGDGQKREATLQAVYADWDAYNVVVTTERPTEGNYTMAVVSPVPQAVCPVNSAGVYGVAPMDCGDQQNNIVFAFHGENDQQNALLHATVISQEIAHSYGLDHTQNQAGIMNPTPSGNDQHFHDGCMPNAGSVFCSGQHEEFCPGGGLDQDSHAELLALLGPKQADLTPPMVSITSPTAGQAFDEGVTVMVTATASDDIGVAEVRLVVDGIDNGAVDAEAPYTWSVPGLAPGGHSLVAIAVDGGENETSSAPVAFDVQSDEPGGADGSGQGGDDDDDDDDDGPTGGLDGFDESGGDGSSGAGLDEGEEGCGCRHTPRTSFAWVLMLFLFGRRSATRSTAAATRTTTRRRATRGR